jgi:hypothetical protein
VKLVIKGWSKPLIIFYNWFWPIIDSIKLTFCFPKDSSSTLQDPAGDDGKNNLLSHSPLSFMILPHEKMDFPAEYREKPSL